MSNTLEQTFLQLTIAYSRKYVPDKIWISVINKIVLICFVNFTDKITVYNRLCIILINYIPSTIIIISEDFTGVGNNFLLFIYDIDDCMW